MQRRRLQMLKAPRIRKKLPPGAVPGSLPMEAEKQATQLMLVMYSDATFKEQTFSQWSEVKAALADAKVTWVHIEGITDAKLFEELGQQFHLHKLALEDVMNNHQRSKVERYKDHTYIVLRTIQGSHPSTTDQLNIFLGDKFVITIQDRRCDWIKPVMERLRLKKGRIRPLGSAYLAYAIIDIIIDTYFPVLERYADRLDELEERLLVNSQEASVSGIHLIQRELLIMRRVIWAQKEMVYSLMREAPAQFDDETALHLRDCHDHLMQQLDLVDTYRDVAANLMELSFSIANSRANEVMKVLTVVATTFIPLTFITGVYGMNFNTNTSPWNMPELNWLYGYPFVICMMGLIAMSLIYFFYRKGWFRKA